MASAELENRRGASHRGFESHPLRQSLALVLVFSRPRSARLLTGSYYGQTVQIWAALLMAALLGCTLVYAIGLTERFTLAHMGARR